MLISETKLRNIIKETITNILLEEYGKWFQTEENDMYQLIALIRKIQPDIENIESLSPVDLWEVIRTLGYINHTAFKVRPGMWDKYPDEMLTTQDFRINKVVYGFKMKALKVIVDYYIRHGLDISTDEKGSIIILRDPITGARQITFHVGKSTELTDVIKNRNGEWDGVRQAHHFTDDASYNAARFKK